MANRKNLYPFFIVLAIASFIAFLAWAAMRASVSGPEVTDADYYSKGLRYTSTILEKKAAASQGWTIHTELSGRTLVISLQDKQGDPVRGAKGSILFFLPGTPGRVEYQLKVSPIFRDQTRQYRHPLRESRCLCAGRDGRSELDRWNMYKSIDCWSDDRSARQRYRVKTTRLRSQVCLPESW